MTRVPGRLALLSLAMILPGLGAPAQSGSPALLMGDTALVASSGSVTQSPTWSGYVVGPGPYTGVAGTFNVPTLASTPTVTFVDEWVGLDGVGSASLIQAGVAETYDPVTNEVSAEAWWQVLPAYSLSQRIETVSVTPGDRITVTIQQVSGTLWSIALANETTGETFTTRQAYQGPGSTAEWIVEAPAGPDGTAQTLGVFSPAVQFTGLQADGPVSTVTAWTMVQGGTAVSAPSARTADGFSVSHVATPAPTLTATQVNTIALGQSFSLSASNGPPYAQVQWQVSPNLVAWSVLTTVTLDGSGNSLYTFAPTRTAYYRALFTDTGQYGPAVIEVVVVQPSPSPPSMPSPAASPSASPPTRGSITGTVVGPGGVPAAGLQVTAVEFPVYGGGSATTAADGTYTIINLAPGSYHMVVADTTGTLPTGYVNGSSLTPFGPLASVIPVGATSTQVNVRVPAGLAVSGIVTADGNPVSGIRLFVCSALDGTMPYSGLVYCGNATTHADGTYSVAVLPGTYTVAFQDHETYPWTFYSAGGATLDGAAATVLTLTGADIGGINVALSGPPAYGSITGTVITSGGSTRPGIFVDACSTAAPAECYGATTDASGRYKVSLPAGTYTVAFDDPANAEPSGFHCSGGLADCPGGFTASLADAASVTVAGSTVGGIDVRLPVGHLVKGTVTGPDGAPLAGIVVTPCASAACNGLAWATRPDGSYALNLAPGNFVLHFTEWSGLYLSGYYASGGLASAAGAMPVSVGAADVTGLDVALHGITASISPGVTRTGPFESGRTVVTRQRGYVTVRIAVGKEFAGSPVEIQVASWTAAGGWTPYRALTVRLVAADGYAYYFVRPSGWMSIRAGVRDLVVSALQTAEGLGDVEVFSGAVVARGL